MRCTSQLENAKKNLEEEKEVDLMEIKKRANIYVLQPHGQSISSGHWSGFLGIPTSIVLQQHANAYIAAQLPGCL